MHFDFRPLFRITFAELSRKYPYSQTPAISRGCTEGKAKTRGLGVWLSQSLTFGNLTTATRIFWCPSPAGPRAAVGGSPLHNDYNTQLSRNKILLSRTWKKTFARVSNITCTAFAIKTPYRSPYIFGWLRQLPYLALVRMILQYAPNCLRKTTEMRNLKITCGSQRIQVWGQWSSTSGHNEGFFHESTR